jgi:hypothetical protein
MLGICIIIIFFWGLVPNIGTVALGCCTWRANDEGVTDEALLALVDAAIAALLSGGAVKSWSDGGHARGHAVEHMSISDLMNLKRELETRIALAGSGGILCMPVVEVDV